MDNDSDTKHHGIILILTVVLIIAAAVIVGYFYFFYVPKADLSEPDLLNKQSRALQTGGSDSAAYTFKFIADGYEQSKQKITFEFVPSADDDLGIFGIKDKLLDVGLTAQLELPESEGLEFTPFAKDLVVFVANNNLELDELTSGQLVDIYSGKVDNWKTLLGQDLTVVPIDRNESDSGKKLFRRIYFKNNLIGHNVFEVHSEADMLRLVESNPGSIGYLSSALAQKSDKVRQIKINGSDPDDADYDLVRTLYLVSLEEPSNVIRDLIEYVTSLDAKNILRQQGLISIN